MLERLLPAIVLAIAGFYLTQAVALPFGSAARPGPGFYPVAIAIFACVVGAAATLRAFLRPAREAAAAATEPPLPGQRRRVLSTTVALVGFTLAMPSIGYPAAAGGFVLVTLLGLGSRWTAALAIAVVSALGSHYLFAVLLDVPLPRGPW